MEIYGSSSIYPQGFFYRCRFRTNEKKAIESIIIVKKVVYLEKRFVETLLQKKRSKPIEY